MKPDHDADAVARQQAHFNDIAARYQDARSHPNHQRLKSLIWDHALADCRWLQRDPLRVLEPMCGFADGFDILSRYSPGMSYRGFDYSDAVVRALQQQRPALDISQQDVTCFATEERFDVIILLGGLHHVPRHAPEVVRNLGACLAPGGRFISLEPTHGNPLFRKVREAIYRRNALFDEETEQAFTPRALASLFLDAGLQCEQVTHPGLLSYVLYYNPDAFPALNRGSDRVVSMLWACEKPWLKSRLARWLSFATLSIWEKPA